MGLIGLLGLIVTATTPSFANFSHFNFMHWQFLSIFRCIEVSFSTLVQRPSAVRSACTPEWQKNKAP